MKEERKQDYRRYNRLSRESRTCLHGHERDDGGCTAKQYYLSEFSLYDGDHFITFNIVDIDSVKNEITVAVSNEGKISVCTYDLKCENECLFFEYGLYLNKIAVDDFEQVEEEN